MMRFWFILVVMLAVSVVSPAQESKQILLMTGKVIEGQVTGTDSLYLYYNYVRRSGKTKAHKLDIERVFSINGSDGEEELVYAMDTAIGNYFTVDEMRYYIKGEQDALEYYRANWTIFAGAPLTTGLGYGLSGTIFVFAVPFAYLVGTGALKYKIPKDRISSPSLITEPAYVLGFERTARTRRLFKSLVTGLVGTAIGFAVGQTHPLQL